MIEKMDPFYKDLYPFQNDAVAKINSIIDCLDSLYKWDYEKTLRLETLENNCLKNEVYIRDRLDKIGTCIDDFMSWQGEAHEALELLLDKQIEKGKAIQNPEDDSDLMIKRMKEHPNIPIYPIAKPGTFEWAFIQMKNGKRVTRRIWNGDLWLQMINYEPPQIWSTQVGVGPTEAHAISSESILATDWEIMK